MPIGGYMNFKIKCREELEKYLRLRKLGDSRKLIDLGRYVDFLKRFNKNPEQFRKVVISFDLLNSKNELIKRGDYRREYIGLSIARSFVDIIEDITIFLVKYDIEFYYEDSSIISGCFFFYNPVSNVRKLIYVTCLKK